MRIARSIAAGSAFALLTFAAGRADAALLNADSFEYTGTALATQNGGLGWNGGWFTTAGASANSLANDATSLNYPATFESPLIGPVPAGDHVRTGGTSSNASTSRLMANPVSLAVDGNVLYCSALIRKNTANGATANDNILLEFTDASANRRFGLGIEGTGDKPWLNANASTTPAAMPPVTAGDTYFIVARIVSSAAGLDTATLKVFGTGYSSQVPFAEPTTWDATQTETTAAILDRIRIRIDSANAAATPGEVDEIRIGTSWESVVPEPSSAALLVLSLAGLAARRRRA